MRAALHNDSEVVNVIEYDPDAAYEPPEGLTLDALRDGARVGPGWRVRGGEYLPPPVESLTTDRDQVPADGSAAAVVTYRNTHDDAPASVTFDVNSATADEQVIDGTAAIEVVAIEPGPIVVKCEGLEVTIEAFQEATA